MDEISAKITAGSLKAAIYSTTTALDAATDPTTPLAYTTTGELTSTGTGYAAGGYVLATPARSSTFAANAETLDFADITTGAGTIATGTYAMTIYDTTDSNRILAICTVTVSVASSSTAMVFSIPSDCMKIA